MPFDFNVCVSSVQAPGTGGIGGGGASTWDVDEDVDEELEEEAETLRNSSRRAANGKKAATAMSHSGEVTVSSEE